MKEDLINSICEGMGKRFKGKSCVYYDSITRECTLLRERTIKELLEQKTNCDTFSMIKSAVAKHLKIGNRKKDYSEYLSDIDYISVIVLDKLKRLGKLKKGYNLPTFIGYICKISQNEVYAFLKKTCGSCYFLSMLKPYVCEKETITKKGEEQPNPHYRKERNPSDKACKEGFRAFTEKSVSHTDSYDEESSDEESSIPDNQSHDIFSKLEIESIIKKLGDRAEYVCDEKTKKRYKRQYHTVINLYQSLADKNELNEAIKTVSEKIGKDEKTVRRDLKEIREYLTLQRHLADNYLKS